MANQLSVFVPSHFGTKKVTRNKLVRTGNKKSIFFGLLEVDERKRQPSVIDTGTQVIGIIDADKLAEDINKQIEFYSDKGYSVLSISPVSNGHHETDQNKGSSYGLGFSYTAGVLILLDKKT